MSIKLAFDHEAFVMQAYGGISRYFTSLVTELDNTEIDAHIYAPFHKNIYLSKMSTNLVTGKYIKSFPPKTATLVNLYNNFKLNKSIKKLKPNILHRTYYGGQNESYDLPVIVTVYDMIHELFPENFSPNDNTKSHKLNSVMRADHIICISESTRKDLIEIYDVPESKTSVVYLASDIRKSEVSHSLKPLLNNPYILFVGNRGGYKNFSNFLASIALSDKLKKSFNILCFGGGEFNSTESEYISSLGFAEEQVTQINGDDNLLCDLYKRARALVYPSKYEGFGLPVLEAMSSGCPVICSDLSSIPEVAGNAAKYFDPNNIEHMSIAIESTLLSDSAIESLRFAGHERSKLFSWKNCAHETLKIYSSLK